MHLKQAIATAALLASTIHNAYAIEWSPIIQSKHYEILVDIDSYKVLAGKPYMTTKTVFKQPQTYLADPESIQYLTRLEQTLFDCQQPQFKQLTVQLLAADQSVLYESKQANGFAPIEQGTDTFSIGQLTCQVHQMLGGQ